MDGLFNPTYGIKRNYYMGSEWCSVIVAFGAVLTAAVIRGYGGVGFAMVVVTGMSLVMPPTLAVPVVLILDVAGGLIACSSTILYLHQLLSIQYLVVQRIRNSRSRMREIRTSGSVGGLGR